MSEGDNFIQLKLYNEQIKAGVKVCVKKFYVHLILYCYIIIGFLDGLFSVDCKHFRITTGYVSFIVVSSVSKTAN